MPSQATVTVEAILDPDELSFLKEAFKRSKRGNGRITVVHLVKCLEEMDYILDGDTKDFIRSVVPKAFEANELGFQDAIKVATSAKTQEGAGEIPVLGRDDSLAQLESSFQTQMQSGEIPEIVAEGEPPPSPILDRDESLAQLERSFAKQFVSGDIPEVIVEKDENDQNGPVVGHTPVVHVDVPRRRSFPGAASQSWKGMIQRSDTLSVLQQQYPAGQEGPNPEVVDLPHRRASSVTHLGEGTLVGLDETLDDNGDSNTTPPASPELIKQTSEEALLETASDTLGVAPVEVSNVPKRRKSLPVSKSWSEAAAKERHNYFVESDVSYDTVDRSGPWWKCIVCAAPPDFNEGDGRSHSSEVQHFDNGQENGEDYAAAVESIRPEMWIKSSGTTASTRSLRPKSSDVCSVM